MAKVTLKPKKALNKQIANLPGVKRAVDRAAQKIKVEAESNLASHKKSGDAHIEIDTDGVDAIVSLVASETGEGWAAASIEFGTGDTEGIYALYRAAGLV